MTHKENLKHRFLLQSLDWLVKKNYKDLLGEDCDRSILIDVTTKLEKPIGDKYWDSHRFVAFPGLNGEQSTYFIFAI